MREPDGSRTRQPVGWRTHEPRGSRGLFALHRTVLLLASTHFIVDGYGNILAPLLPLLKTRLDLSLFAVGTLQMFFQWPTRSASSPSGISRTGVGLVYC